MKMLVACSQFVDAYNGAALWNVFIEYLAVTDTFLAAIIIVEFLMILALQPLRYRYCSLSCFVEQKSSVLKKKKE